MNQDRYPDKAKAITDMPRPTDVEGVNYCLADIMEPIRRLTLKDKPWNWSEEQDSAFQEVQKLVTQGPILIYYDPSSPLAIQCDPS